MRLAIPVSTAWALTQSYGVGLVLIREGSQGQNSGIDSMGYPLNPVIKAAVTGFFVRRRIQSQGDIE